MSQYWMIIERFENWRVDKSSNFTVFGLSRRYRRMAESMQKGDLIFGYVSSGISAFADIRLVEEAGIKPLRRSFDYDSAFDYYIATSPLIVLERTQWLPLKEVLSALDLTRDRSEWRQLFRTTLRQLTEHDGTLLKREIEVRQGSS